ncbi:hypothetical protein [Psychromarinibacter sp. S121]|uniref:hypothetical protein n=1 Tax=Psychromarinibacter sp. S121 TaxID=3415127 RepID=UPI003C7B2EC2
MTRTVARASGLTEGVPATGLGRLDRAYGLAWLALAVVAAILSAIFLLPRATYSAAYVGDVLVALEGAYRIAAGQWPSVDFKSPLGFMSYWLPYIGWQTLGQFGGAMEFASVLLAVIVTPMAMIMAQARVGAILSALFSIWVFCLLVVPMEPGMPGTWSNQSMHYNRWGWPILSTILLLGIEPRDAMRPRWRTALDVAFVAVLLFFLFWLKVTYFAFGGAFLAIAFLIAPRLRWTAFAAGAAALVLVGLSGLAGLGIVEYINDIREAGAASGVVRGGFIGLIVNNALEFFLVAVMAAYLLTVTRPSLFDIAVFLFVPLAGMIILGQNHHDNGPLLLAFLFLYGARMHQGPPRPELPVLLLVVFAVPHMAQMAMSTLTFARNANAQSVAIGYPGFETYYVGDTRSNALSVVAAAETPEQAFVAGRLIGSERHTHIYSQGEMLEMIGQGVTLLEENDLTDLRIIAFDFLNPFPMFVGAPPLAGIHIWFHPGRNISDGTLPPAGEFLAEAEVVMVAKLGFSDATALLWETYGDDVEDRYDLVGENDIWRVYRVRPDAG